MWELVGITNAHDSELGASHRIVLSTPRVFTIGRTDCDLILVDKSISRNHATLELVETPNNHLRIYLKDVSRFGTKVNGKALTRTKQELRTGDHITFGVQPGIDFTLKAFHLTITVSSVDKSTKQRMKHVTSLLHVVTAKVITALLNSTPIVTPDFMEALYTSVQHIPFHMPDTANFLPPMKEVRLSDADADRFLPDPKRRTLFKNMKFFVLTQEQFTSLSKIVEFGGGEIYLLNGSRAFVHHYKVQFSAEPTDVDACLKRILQHRSNCVIHTQQISTDAAGKQWQRAVYASLRSIRHRPILESELGFSVIYRSTNGYCNPRTKCPEKLYQEAGISQAFSVNPFHMETQPVNTDDVSKELHSDNSIQKNITECQSNDVEIRPANTGDVLKELSSHISDPKPIVARQSLKRQRPIEQAISIAGSDEHLVNEKTNSIPCVSPNSRKRRCERTNILPAVKIASPGQPKIRLVADSEPFNATPNNLTALNTLKIEEDLPDSPHSADGNELPPFPKLPGLQTVPEHNEIEQDDLDYLFNMPSLVLHTTSAQSSEPVLTPPKEKSNKIQCPNLPADSACNEVICGDVHGPTDPIIIAPQRTDSPSKSADSSAWLTKKKDYLPVLDNSQVEEAAPSTGAQTELVDFLLCRPFAPHFQSTPFTQDLCIVNYKRFKKVWPLQHGVIQTVAPKEVPIVLIPFIPQSAYTVDEPMVDTVQRSSQHAQVERVNRLFEQMCQLPKC